MTLKEMFVDSVQLKDFLDGLTADTELQEVMLGAQLAVNAFIANLGDVLVSTFIADTFMMYCEAFNNDTFKFFSVCAIIMNRETHQQTSFVVPFKLQLVKHGEYEAGLYVL